MRFEPIAIVGSSCILPGALSPAALWANVRSGRTLITGAPDGRWDLPRAWALGSGDPDRAYSDAGGYVRGFEPQPLPAGFDLPAPLLELDPLFQWVIQGAHEALEPIGHEGRSDRAGLILGNLSFPSRSLAQYAEHVWLTQQGPGFLRGQAAELAGLSRPHPLNRFMSGLPALLAARALGLGAGAFALDAACASALYAIKIACDWLHDRKADVMVAGAVNAADAMFIHIGFGALSAMSKSGQSRPFSRDADGLVPAEGAGFVCLKRLADAERAGDRILGVIRGVGLSNDGRGRGLLVPSEEGQVRAMLQAYAVSGLVPGDIGYVECHATGTPLGDATELRSMATVFADAKQLPIGSIKANLGHLITAAGMASVFKVLAGMTEEVLPPTPSVERPIEELGRGRFRLPTELEPWPGERPRRAAVNTFGFGGNNAHLLLEQWRGQGPQRGSKGADPRASKAETDVHEPAPGLPQPVPVAVVGLCALIGEDQEPNDFSAQLFAHAPAAGSRRQIALGLDGLRFPPSDLKQTLPQQLFILELARAVASNLSLPRERTSVLIGMGTDPEVARYGARWQLGPWSEGWAAALKAQPTDEWLSTARAAAQGPLSAAGVLGTMPNIPANRINSQLDLAGPSMTVSAEELSGLAALKLGLRALAVGEVDAALVGAVDLSDEPVQRAALAELGLPQLCADGAVVIALKRLEDARRDGDRVWAVFEQAEPTLRIGDAPEAVDLLAQRGRAHAASGLLQVASAVVALHHGVRPGPKRSALPWFGSRAIEVSASALAAQERVSVCAEGPARPFYFGGTPVWRVYAGANRAAVQAALASAQSSVGARAPAGEQDSEGPARLVIVAFSPEEEAARTREAQRYLEHGGALPEGVVFCERPIGGELAFVFTGAAAAYPGMGSELLLALPQLAEPFLTKLAELPHAARALQRGFSKPEHPLDQLWACSLLCQSHAELSQRVLGLSPAAVIGYSSGESNGLFALGAWRDPNRMYTEVAEGPIFAREICGEFAALGRAWQKQGVEARGAAREQNMTEAREPTDDSRGAFASFAVAAPLALVQAALAGEKRAHVTCLNSPNECVIGGEPEACSRVLARLGKERAVRIPYELAAHCPELEEIREAWFELHRRQTWDVPGVRFYWNGFGEARPLGEQQAAEAITRQALQMLDFPRLVERAYADGVRVFVEHGPRSLCSGWIDAILGDREHLAVALDSTDRASTRQAAYAAGALLAHGVPVDTTKLAAALVEARGSEREPDRHDAVARPGAASLTVAAHPAELRLPPLAQDVERMAPAPWLPPLIDPALVRGALSSPTDARTATASGTRASAREHALPTRVEAQKPPPAQQPVPSAHRVPAAVTRAAATAASGLGGVAIASAAPQASARPTRAAVEARAPDQDARAVVQGQRVEPRLAVEARGSAREPNSAQRRAALVQMGQQRQLTAVHRAFLEQQAEVQQRFLGLQQQMLASLVHALPRVASPAMAGPSATTSAERPRPMQNLVEPPAAPLPKAAPAPQSRGVQQSTALVARRAHAVPQVPTPATRPAQDLIAKPGPKFSREELLIHASGRISSIFGSAFAEQDGFARQVRMPEPPLLLVDRVTGIRGEPGSMGTGTIWTETDVRADSWYMQDGRLPAGIMIEAGQADLMLISWLGVDRYNRGERVYRLLGCELTYHGELPRVGETLAYEIHIDGHAQQGDTRLFFFHYDCHIAGRRALSVRRGQAGFFSDAELADSAGILWSPETAEHVSTEPLAAPRVACTKRTFDKDELRAFAEGRAFACFGAGFELAETHVDPPRIAAGQLQLLERVTEFDPCGGPWKRGYLRAELSIDAGDWFFAGHFKNDPCMPGTLMFEGCLQAMAFYLAALGFTLERDGYRFEPVPEQPSLMRCRGQVSPSAKCLVYEVFVREVSEGPTPTLQADLLCTVDGLKAFHAQRFGLRLAPDWPLERWKLLPAGAQLRGGEPFEQRRLGGLSGYVEPKPVASHDGFAFDYASLLACAWGRPTTAFGPFYKPFDSARRVARLPGPPYHFVSRVLRIEAELGQLRQGAAVEVEYDVPNDVWYFDDNGSPTMPLCVLMEAALQPCGWLASYIGSTLASHTDTDLMFRNLDGTASLTGEIRPDSGPLRTRARITNISRSGEMIIQTFEVVSSLGDQPIYRMNTVFGFFPKEAFENQAGLPVKPEERARIAAPASETLDLRARPARYFEAAPRLASGMLLMLDRITAYEAHGGAKGLGWARAEKDVNPSEWFFKAHFFQDPVQPGSLGIEAFCQLLQFVMLEQGMMDGIENPHFEPIALGKPLSWKYRGQVVPKNRRITTELELVEVGEDERGRYALADAFLWVDGKRIYQAKGLGMRIVRGEHTEPRGPAPSSSSATVPSAAGAGQASNGALTRRAAPAAGLRRPASISAESEASEQSVEARAQSRDPNEEVLDPAVDTWLLDHCPTWTLPALPMMSMVDRLAAAAQRAHSGVEAREQNLFTELSQVQVRRWLPFPGGPVRLRTELSQAGDWVDVTLTAFRHAKSEALSRFEPVATGRVRLGSTPLPAPTAWSPLVGGELMEDPYASGALFHGPSFQLLRSLRIDGGGASAVLDLAADRVPPGALRQGLLDALTHAIPHTELYRWSPEIPRDHVAYPYRVPRLQLYGPLPAQGIGRVEVRFAGFDDDPRLPRMDIQLIVDEQVLAALRLVEILLPKGPLGVAAPSARRAFLRDRTYVPGLALSERAGAATELTLATLRQSDWLPGNVARIYGVAEARGGSAREQNAEVREQDADLLAQVAVKDHVAARAAVHPANVVLAPDGTSASTRQRPLRRYPIRLERGDSQVSVADAGPAWLDLSLLRNFWRDHFAIGPSPVEDLYCALAEQFVADVVLTDPDGFEQLRGKSALYLANHQVGIESLMFSLLIPALSGLITVTLAKGQHRESWIGGLIEQSFAYPGLRDPGMIRFFDREDPGALPRIAQTIASELATNRKSAMIHVEGTRALSCRQPVSKLSSAVTEMALAANCPIVPVRFVGGLPVEPLTERLEFPLGYGRQEIWIGAPIGAEELRRCNLKQRIECVTAAINATGPSYLEERPSDPNPQLAEQVRAWTAQAGCTAEDATLIAALRASAPQSPLMAQFCAQLALRADRGQDGPRLPLSFGEGAEGRWLAGFAERLPRLRARNA